MGKDKKHKKHKSDRKERHEDPPSVRSSSLKLVLKVGTASTPEHEQPPPPPVAPLRFNMAAITEAETHRKEKKHKKKKKKDKERDKERHRQKKERRRLESVGSGAQEEASHLSSSTEPLSQRTSTSPEPGSVPAHRPLLGDEDEEEQSMEQVTAFLRASSRPAPAEEEVTSPLSQQPGSPAPTAPPADAQFQDSPVRRRLSSADHHHLPSPISLSSSTAAMSPSIVLDRLSVPPELQPPLRHQSPSPPPPPPPPPKPALQQFLEYLLRGLEKKDTQRFFGAPVTDALAPGYSSVIQHPMDFSTMLGKVEAGSYGSLAEFQEDFRLMCSNAMAYNRPDTVYYKAARRLMHIGSKMMSPEKLMSLRAVVPAMWQLAPDVLGFQMAPAAALSESAAAAPLVELEPVDEAAEAEAILAQAQAAARRAADRLAARKTAPKLGYLKQRVDGSTCIAVLTPDDEDLAGDERPLAPSVLTGKLSQGGMSQAATARDEKRGALRPARPPPFGVGGFEEPFGAISREEAELLAQTYGDDVCQQYAQSVREFSAGCAPASAAADRLLDTLTDGRHRRARHLLELHRQLAIEESVVSRALAAAAQPPPLPAPPAAAQVDFAALKSLSTLGIDIGFLDTLEAEERRMRESAAPESGQRRRGSAHVPGLERAAGPRQCGAAAPSPDNASSHEEVDVEAVSTAATPEVRCAESPAGQPGLHELLADV